MTAFQCEKSPICPLLRDARQTKVDLSQALRAAQERIRKLEDIASSLKKQLAGAATDRITRKDLVHG